MKASSDLLLFLVKRLANARGEARDRAPKKRREQTAQKETGNIFTTAPMESDPTSAWSTDSRHLPQARHEGSHMEQPTEHHKAQRQ